MLPINEDRLFTLLFLLLYKNFFIICNPISGYLRLFLCYWGLPFLCLCLSVLSVFSRAASASDLRSLQFLYWFLCRVRDTDLVFFFYIWLFTTQWIIFSWLFYVLASVFVNLVQTPDKPQLREIPPSNWSIGRCVDIFLINVWYERVQLILWV